MGRSSAEKRRRIASGVVRSAYPERREEQLSPFDEWGSRLGGALLERARPERRRWREIPKLVAAHCAGLATASQAELSESNTALRVALSEHGFRDDVVARAFALVREVSRRELGMAHYDAQLMGGWLLLHGMVAEMQTGEGKTLTALLPAATVALSGSPVHIVTVNDYLAKRDAETMGPVYRALGLSVGIIISGMDPAARRDAYAADITYCTNKEVAFDYLKDRITLHGHPTRLRLQLERLGGSERTQNLIHRGLHYAIVDEADSVLIDEARTPLIISDRKRDATEEGIYRTGLELARGLERGRDFTLDERERQARYTDAGREHLRELAEPHGGLWRGQRRREHFVAQALSALHFFHRDHHYLIADDKVQIVDEYTGRVMPDRSWEHGMHQMIEMKEGVTLTGRQETLARISYQRFFGRYLRLAGMTGTASEVSSELWSTYRLSVVAVPTNRPCQRTMLAERVFASQDEKWDAIVARIAELTLERRPVLVGTRSVKASEHLSKLLEVRGISHRVLNARQDREEAQIIAEAGEPGRVTVATNMAGRGTDILLAEGVGDIGGLHVIATERHESGRIDRQLFGRCGRQGDPGSAEAIVSIEDELCAVYSGPIGKRLARVGAARDSGLAKWARSGVLRAAQRNAGRLNARIRRDLIKQGRQLERMLSFSGRSD